MPRLGRFLVCWLGGLLLASGCGVADYEGKMLSAQKRLERYEEESRLLGNPLTLPSRDTKDAGKQRIAHLFLRPPKGISTTAENESEPRNRLLYSYRPRSANAAGGVALVELAAGDQKDFAAEVLRCVNPSGKAASRTREVRHPLRQTATTFETTEFEDDQYFYTVNVWRGAKNQIAVVYWVFKDRRAGASKAVDLSLESFAVDAEASRQQKSWHLSPLKMTEPPK
jgi:hypothetical protein